MYNPSVTQEARYEPASVIPVKTGTSLIDWLIETNRLIPRDKVEKEETNAEDVDLSDFIDNDDTIYSDGDDDDDDLTLEEEG